MALTLDEIRREGLDALRCRLGRAGMIRFLQQFEKGEGDYSKSRHKWVDSVSLEELLGASGTKRTKSSSRGKRR